MSPISLKGMWNGAWRFDLRGWRRHTHSGATARWSRVVRVWRLSARTEPIIFGRVRSRATQCGVVCELQRQLDAFWQTKGNASQQFSALSVWLGEVPLGVQQWLWRTVCLAAISTTDLGRSFLAAAVLSNRTAGQQLVVTASNSSVARVWDLMAAVCASARLPRPAGLRVVATQPFIRFRGSWTVCRVPLTIFHLGMR